MKLQILKSAPIYLILTFSLFNCRAVTAQSGGDFTITQSVVAGGGGQQSAGGTFSIDGTIGQPLAGGLMSNPPFDLFSGFWTPELSLQTGTVSGRVTYANALTTTSVPFATLNAAGSLLLSGMTDSNGFYSFTGFGAGAYTVTPTKTGQINGISNLDASRVAQHIVGLTTLNSTQLIAADTSGNGTIGSLDAAYIAQFVASIPNPGITGSWKFLPPSRSYPNVQSNQTNQDYSAVLVGDVTGNWNPAGPLHFELSNWNPAGTPGFDLSTVESKEAPHTDKAAQKEVITVTAQTNQTTGEETTLTVNLTAADVTGKGILGYQFDVLYDGELIKPQSEACAVSETISRGMTAICRVSERGGLKVVVYGTAPLTGEGILLKLVFKAEEAKNSTLFLSIENFIFNEDMPAAVTVK